MGEPFFFLSEAVSRYVAQASLEPGIFLFQPPMHNYANICLETCIGFVWRGQVLYIPDWSLTCYAAADGPELLFLLSPPPFT